MGSPEARLAGDHLLFILSILDLGGKRLSSTSSRDAGTCGGGNMSVRVDVVRELGGFDTQFGSRPESPMDRGEDQDLQRRLAAVGYETWYEPSMVAHHYVPPERLTEAYFEPSSARARRPRPVRPAAPRVSTASCARRSGTCSPGWTAGRHGARSPDSSSRTVGA